MADFTRLNAATEALQTEVTNIGTQMDAMKSSDDQVAADAAAAAVEAQVQALKDIGARNAVMPTPAP